MRIFSLTLLVCISNYCIAQNEDYPDYRSKKDIITRITEKDIRSDVASFSLAGIEESVGKLPLKTLPVTKFSPADISFGAGNIEVNITSAPFVLTKHKLGYYDPEKKHLIKIDNKPYFGDYGKVPRTVIEKLSVVIDKDTVAIPPTAYSDIYNPVFTIAEHGTQKSSNKVLLSADGKKIYIYMVRPEAGGNYEVTWVIQDKKYLRRVVDFGFMK